MTLAAVLCCIMASTLFSGCEKDKDKFSYSIIVQPSGMTTGANAVIWHDAVLGVYQAALGTDSEDFTKNGTQEECDKEVLDACKRAETAITVRGTGEVRVHNRTTNQTVYRRVIQ